MQVERLQGIELFEGVSDEDLATCAALFEETEILAGSGFTREGDFAYKFFVVLEGEVEVLREFDHLANLGPGEFFGEMGVVSGERRNARVVATTRCVVGSVMPWDFQKMTETVPVIAERIQTVIDLRAAESTDTPS